ncbi:helix-turn-helix domain-containing protein [Actinotignum urinale]|uniref:Helix-turn-helix domain-containing protein n=1 Tax=Actinotignum urinale TaxID=190146 RepID=A0AAW9HWT9_9ACTO|nr:helix-turn-helix domain-containing protein [Actinotignum urinale]MDY5154271.1 helix-turn-helix domain-containing protein [Actinotignum urinale]MDY5159580.1 helix-turn-helix domain-containing protein [Actinotignum urinale]
MDYTATIEITTSKAPEDIHDALEAYGVSVAEQPEGYRTIFTYPATTLKQAITTGLTLIESVGTPYTFEVKPSQLEEIENKSGNLPPLLSAKEAGERLGITPQAVKNRIEAGTLSGTKVGNQWIVPLHSVLANM